MNVRSLFLGNFLLVLAPNAFSAASESSAPLLVGEIVVTSPCYAEQIKVALCTSYGAAQTFCINNALVLKQQAAYGLEIIKENPKTSIAVATVLAAAIYYRKTIEKALKNNAFVGALAAIGVSAAVYKVAGN